MFCKKPVRLLSVGMLSEETDEGGLYSTKGTEESIKQADNSF
jgi:hypothetical protein